MYQADLMRLLDVNFNRAAEGLRTLEDIARVVRRDPTASGWLKSLRHQLGELAALIPRQERLEARSVVSDAGTGLTHPGELARGDESALIAAAAERVTQSLRVVEEAVKLSYPEIAGACKQLRYLAYDRLAQVESRLNMEGRRFPADSLYVLVDCCLPLDDFANRLIELVEAGVGLFQIRDKSKESLELLRYSQTAVEAVGAERVIVNDRVDIALASGAGGVHVGQEDLPIHAVQAIAGRRLWIGVSTHDLAQAKQAQACGADYIGCGPTFPSTTKQFSEFAGLEFLRQVAQEIDLPAYAIGGIQSGNISQVQQAGIGRVAISSAIWSSENPRREAESLAGQLARDAKSSAI